MKPEQRVTSGCVEARAAEGEPNRLVGYAAVYNREAVIAGLFREQILPGAFTEAIGRDDVRAQFNHGAGGVLPLGRTSAGTLRLSEDATGLRYEIDLPDTQQARDLWVSVKRGDVAESSFMFSVSSTDDEEWDYAGRNDGKLPLRSIRRVTLFDVSPVTFPAYSDTSVSARALDLAGRTDVQVMAPTVPAEPDPAIDHVLAQLDLDEASV